MIITHEDAKAVGFCNKGLRRWFRGKDVTFDQFRQEGVSVEWARQQNDGMAQQLIAYVEEHNVEPR